MVLEDTVLVFYKVHKTVTKIVTLDTRMLNYYMYLSVTLLFLYCT